MIAVAYGTSAPQLGVAEFAPAAQSALEAPPSTQSDSGPGAASGRRRNTTTTTAAPGSSAPDGSLAAAPTTRVARARSCVGNPPRQTEDPQSPPCLATIFEGDNGGATARGVNATEIRIGIPSISSDDTSYRPAVDAMFDHFNERFELYGRRLVPVYVGGYASDAVQARAVAADVVEEGVFGALTGMSEWALGQPALPAELGRQGVVTIVRAGTTWWSDRTMYDPFHPYLWSVYPSAEDQQANIGGFLCRSLAQRAASFAGDDDLQAKQRRFGVLALGVESAPPTNVLMSALEGCTGESAVTVKSTTSGGGGSAALRAGMEKLAADEATTLVCVCEGWELNSAMSAAHGIGYHPEWITTPTYYGTSNDEVWLQPLTLSGQVAPPVRISAGPKLLPLQARPWFSIIEPVLGSAENGSGTSIVVTSMAEFFYPQLMVLASGIQGAGPSLSPDTFAQALMSTQFPNTGAGASPFWQSSVGFGPGDHAFYDDYSVGWWSDAAPALEQGVGARATGSWCYLDQGARFTPGTYPTDAADRLFNAGVACR